MQNQMQASKQEQQQQQQIPRSKNSRHSYGENPTMEEKEVEDTSRSALSAFRAKEELIAKKKMEVTEKVFAQLGRVEEESKRLAGIRAELEVMADPTKKEIAAIRKKIDAINRELKHRGQSCLQKEKEYKEALEVFNRKNKAKAQLINKLVELVNESEQLRMRRLEELSKTMESLR
ncbi:uncharacterized protein [Typha angustifolia]|uniref:uncharacterized protein n=1 Tax=Typha angustifolia TaxID=59011 RepID=UPI003C2E1D6D